MATRYAVVVEAGLALRPGADHRAPGGAVTVSLCGHWRHEGPCRWPHHSRIDTSEEAARLRTVVVVDGGTEDEVLARVAASLAADPRWDLVSCRRDGVAADESSLAESLLKSP